ncbi:MAG: tetratricopeptide repeat protein [Gemmataceae bacterium]
MKSADPVAPRRLNTSLPRDLDTIILKCLQKEPGRRYASAADLAEDLRRWQAKEPIRARPVGRLERGAMWARRNPAAAGLLVALAAAAVVTVVMLYSLARASQARQAALEASTRSRWVSEIMIGRIEDPLLLDAGAYSLPEEIGKQTRFVEVLRRAVQKTNQQLADQPAQQAALLAVIGSGYRSMGMYEPAEAHLERALAVWREQGPARRLDVADALHQLGLVRHERGRYEKDDFERAKRCYREALEIYDRAGSDLAIETRLTLASLHQGEEDYASAKEIHQRVKDDYEARKLKRDRNYYRAEMGLIAEKVEAASVGKDFTPLVVSEMLGPIEELVRLEPDKSWQRVVELFKAASLQMIGARNGAMAAEDQKKARQAAEATFLRCADLIQREYGGEHNYRAVPLIGLAASQADRGDWAAAARASLEAVQAFRATTGLAHEKAPYVASRAAYYLYRRDGHTAEAIKLLDEVMKALEKRSGKKHHLYANGLMFRAWFSREVGDRSAMRSCCEAAKAIYDQAPLRSKYRLYPLCERYLAEAK